MIELNPAGYNLIEGRNDTWYVQVIGEVAYKGTFSEVYMFCVYRLGFKSKEIEDAITEMVANGHNAAHFGSIKYFIYSFNQDLTKKEAA